MITIKFVKEHLKLNKWKITGLLLLTLILLSSVFSGCDTTGSSTPAEVDSIEVSLRAVMMNTGLEILLIPRDSEGFLVETDGSLDAELWLQEYITYDAVPHIYLIQGWNDVQISSDDYTQFQGVKVDLMYDEEQSFKEVYGSLEVTLVTPDGKSLTYTLKNIRIAESYSRSG